MKYLETFALRLSYYKRRARYYSKGTNNFKRNSNNLANVDIEERFTETYPKIIESSGNLTFSRSLINVINCAVIQIFSYTTHKHCLDLYHDG